MDRTGVRRLAVDGGVLRAIVVAGAIALVVTSCSSTIPPTQPTPDLSTLTEITASPTATATASSSTEPSNSPAVHVVAHRDCQPSDLDPRPWYTGEGGHSTTGYGVVVQNRSATACLMGGNPKLLVTDSTGHRTPFPYDSPCAANCSAVTVVPGGYAGFTIYTVDFPMAPTCPPPNRPFHGFVVQWVTGPQYPLPGFTLSLDCGPTQLLPWALVTDPLTSAPNVSRAPMPTGTPSP
jgi:hypothetical protein